MENSKKNENRLHPDNCNKAECKTCIFGRTPLLLAPDRMAEIQRYLAVGEAAHICHTTNKTCYGSLEFQSQIFHRMGIIQEPTPESLLKEAGKHLKFNKEKEPDPGEDLGRQVKRRRG
jgi:hypothetical protein